MDRSSGLSAGGGCFRGKGLHTACFGLHFYRIDLRFSRFLPSLPAREQDGTAYKRKGTAYKFCSLASLKGRISILTKNTNYEKRKTDFRQKSSLSARALLPTLIRRIKSSAAVLRTGRYLLVPHLRSLCYSRLYLRPGMRRYLDYPASDMLMPLL